jgi:TldD protein
MEEFVDKALDYASKRARFAEVRYCSSTRNVVLLKNGTVSASGYSIDSGISIRILNKSIAFTSINIANWEQLKDGIDRAIRMSERSGREKFSSEDPVNDFWEVDQRKKIEDVPFEERVSEMKELDGQLANEKIPMRILSLGDNIEEEYNVNSEGTSIRSKLPKVGFFAMIGFLENGSFEQGTVEVGYSGGYEALEAWKLGDRLKHESDVLKKAAMAKKLGDGVYDLIAGPEISGIVAHESAGHPTESDRILGREMAQAGESFIKKNDRGKRIGSDIVNLVDDPTLDHSFGYYKYDRDGVRARKRYLYKAGLINDFLSNRESAGRMESKSNGASRSSEWDKEPLVRMSTTFIEPKDYKFEELIENVKEGVYMKSFTEWNIDDIRYNEKYVGREAYHVQNGEIMEAIRRPIIETTTVNFYSSIDAIGRDLEFSAGTCGKGDPMQGVDVWMGGPHIRLRGISVR